MDTENMRTLLMSRKMRATPKRLALLALMRKAIHPRTVEELHAKLRGTDLVTVYRNLQALAAAGIIREIRFNDAAVRYEFAAEGHHHHLVCDSCGTIEDIEYCPVPAATSQALRASKRFRTVNTHAFELFGTCVSCA